MELACLDLEGVLIPEIWIGFAEKNWDRFSPSHYP